MKDKFANRDNWNKIMQKIQKGGKFNSPNEFVYIFVMNIFIFISYNVIFICLFKFNNSYSFIYYLLIGLIIISFFSCIFTLYFNPIGKSLKGEEGYNIINLIASFVLSSTQFLQFVSAILVFLVFYSSPMPSSNTVNMTTTNSDNLFYYKIMYIYTYLASIIFVIMITAIDNNLGDGNITINVMLGIVGLVLCVLVSYMFYTGYKTYENVVLNGNQLFQGSPRSNKEAEDAAAMNTGTANQAIIVAPQPTLPRCTPATNSGSAVAPSNPNDQCYT